MMMMRSLILVWLLAVSAATSDREGRFLTAEDDYDEEHGLEDQGIVDEGLASLEGGRELFLRKHIQSRWPGNEDSDDSGDDLGGVDDPVKFLKQKLEGVFKKEDGKKNGGWMKSFGRKSRVERKVMVYLKHHPKMLAELRKLESEGKDTQARLRKHITKMVRAASKKEGDAEAEKEVEKEVVEELTEAATGKVPQKFPVGSPPDGGGNYCAGKKPDLPNVQCVIGQVFKTGEQAGTNVTVGYKGMRNSTSQPIAVPFYQAGLCPVNVHWHLGTEHLSVGEYDETGVGPLMEGAHRERRTLAGGHNVVAGGNHVVREGHQCKLYDKADTKFTTPYAWQHCKNMEVGQTYEIHWPHSARGACGTPNQYQTPFYDGVFCHAVNDTAKQIGVQAQVFTIVNDEAYYWPNLIHGMIVDGQKGKAITKYTGSTTGTSRDNEICSQYAPISWQVDRKCHLISASSFDKMCADMLSQRDDMSADTEPHGARKVVTDKLAANDHLNRYL